MRFLAAAKLSDKKHVTPEGFLACEDAVLARTGPQQYHKNENPEFRDAMFPNGSFWVDREPEDVFSPKTLASVNGKPVVNDHPRGNSFVDSKNYNQLAIGHILNPRRGTGDEADLMLGDLLITNHDAIMDIMHGKKELSLGYDAQYEPNGEGRFKQKNFVVNHVALVDKGRCGPRCCIGDAAHCDCEDCKQMVKRNNHRSLVEKLRKVFTTGDADEQASAVEELLEQPAEDAAGSEGDTHVHIHAGEGGEPAVERSEDEEPGWFKTFKDSFEERMGKLETPQTQDDDEDEEIEGQLEAESPKGVTGDRARKAADSALLSDAFQETASLAEAIAPGITIPAFDSKAKPKATLDSIGSLRRKALQVGYAKLETRELIEKVIGGRTLDANKMTLDSLRTTFVAVGNLAKDANNKRASSRTADDDSRGGMLSSPTTIAQINEINRLRREKRHTAH